MMYVYNAANCVQMYANAIKQMSEYAEYEGRQERDINYAVGAQK